MMYGLAGRAIYNSIIKAFVENVGGEFIPVQHFVEPKRQAPWVGFNIFEDENLRNKWLRERTPLVFFGIARGTHVLINLCKEHNIPFYYMDHAYFGVGHGDYRTKFRIIYNGEHINRILEKTNVRHNFKHKINEKTSKGDKVLVCPPTEFVQNLYSITEKDWIDNIRKNTDREIVIRRKTEQKSFDQQLSESHCIVTHYSTVAINAIFNGLPSFCDKISFAAPMSQTNYDFENPYYPTKASILEWTDTLKTCQFSSEEIISGEAKEIIDNTQGNKTYD